jgi:hypothetical protein
MTKFYKENTDVKCSQFDELGYFIQNTTEFVSKGTALGPEFTTNLYEPKEGYVGKYDKDTNTWENVASNLGKIFYAPNGEQFIIDTIDGVLPEWAIKEAPPEYDPKTQTVLHKDNAWKVYEIKLGDKYYDEDGHELTISDFNFDLPQNHTFTQPPEYDQEKGQTVKLIDGKWLVYTQCTVYLKADCNQSAELEDKSLMSKEYTLIKPKTQFDEWVNGKWVTNLANKYIAEFNQTDSTRSTLYAQYCDPLMNEARIKRLQDKDSEAGALEAQALAAREKIVADNPWPINPTV